MLDASMAAREQTAVPPASARPRHGHALRRTLTLNSTVVVAAIAVATASAATVSRSRSVSRDGTTATIRYHRATINGPVPFSDLRLAISRDGRRLRDGPVRSAFCRTLCWPALVPGVPPLRVVDLEPGGSPDVVLNLYSGGAHCCYITQVYRFAAGRYARVEHDFGDPGATFERLGPRFVFFSADDRFAYRFEPFAFSAFPVQIWTFARGRFADVTRDYPRLVAVDAHQQWLSFAANDPQGTGLGFLAAWAADQDLLGRSALVARRLATLRSEGRLRSTLPFTPHGAAFIAALQRFLGKAGYLT
jgi:hypothetical protein